MKTTDDKVSSSTLDRLRRSKAMAWGAVAVWMAVIFALSAQAHSGDITEQYLHDYNISVRKCAHMFEYFVLFLLLRHATRLTWSRSLSWLPFLIAVFYAMTDEFHQMFVPGRSGTINDVLVDSTGAAIAWLLAKFLLPRLRPLILSRDRNGQDPS